VRRRALAGLALAVAGVAGAAGRDAAWYVQVDNDVVFTTDRWYTSGVRIARLERDFEWGLVQEIYTPDAKNPRPVDRAPAGRLLASVAHHDRSAEVWCTLEAALGVRGPAALGRQSTDYIHRLIPAPAVDWSRQLENRLDAQLAFTRSEILGLGLVKAHYGAVLGTQRAFAHAGIEIRAGANRSMASALLRFAPTPPLALQSAPGWNAYAGASGRAVGRDELVSRNYNPFGPPLSRRNAIGRLVAGVAWTQPWGTLTFEIAQDSREFDGQHAPHRFGSLAFHLDF